MTLQAIAAACPHLQLLLLGGSTIGATPQGRAGQLPGNAETWDAAVAAVRAWTDAHADRCCHEAAHPASQDCLHLCMLPCTIWGETVHGGLAT